ncbi:hypothetical protein [Flavobacterium psychrotolerans]|nr:hypothetical protein [Flavobacterium psychrotolerans]
MSNPVSISSGELFRNYFSKNKISKSALAKKIGMPYSNLLRYTVTRNKPLETMLKICVGLEHNFFQDIAAKLPSHYTTDVPKDTAAIVEIESLKGKIRILESEKELLLQVLKR